jgi:hypothetical protein
MTSTKQPKRLDDVIESIKGDTVVIGPVVWYPKGGGDRTWAFGFQAGDYGDTRYAATQVGCPNAHSHEEAQNNRDLFLAALVTASFEKPRAIHDVDDELVMARMTANIWPCERSAKMLADLKAETAAERVTA